MNDTMFGIKSAICPTCGITFVPAPENVFRVNNHDYCTYTCFCKRTKPKSSYKKVGYRNTRRVLAYTRDGEYVGEYASGAEAARALGVSQNGVYQCCYGYQKRTGQYTFKFKKRGKRK